MSTYDPTTHRSATLSRWKRYWDLGGLSFRELVRRVASEVDTDDVPGRAAQLSYYFLLALFPLLIFCSALIGTLFANNVELYQDLLGYLRSVMPYSAFELVRNTVDEITTGASGNKLSLGFIATLWTASSGMDAIISGITVAYGLSEKRPWWKRRLIALGLTLLLSGMVGGVLLLILSGGRIGDFIAFTAGMGDRFDTIWTAVRICVPPAFMFAVLLVIYRLSPPVRPRRWEMVIPGSVIALGLWLSATGLFRLYLRFFGSYNKTYGSLGTVIVLMLWLYLFGIAILIGAEVNSELYKVEDEDNDNNTQAAAATS